MKIPAKFKRVVIVLCIIVGMLMFWGLGGLTSAIYAQSSQQKLVWQMTAEDHYVKGLAYVGALGRNGVLAISSFTQAIRLNPNYAEAYLERGKVRSSLNSGDNSLSQRNIQDAIADFTQAIRLNSNYAEAYFERARIYYSLEEKQQAINDLTQAIQVTPNYAEAYYQRGLIYSELQNKQAAVEDYVQVIQLDRGHRAYRSDNQRAIKNHEKVIKDNLNFAHAYYQGLASYYISEWYYSPFSENLGNFSRAIELDPNNADAYYYRARIDSYADLDNKISAITDLTKAIQLNQNFAESYYWRGVKRLGLDSKYSRFNLDASPIDTSIAIPDFTKAIELNPDYADAYYVRGLAYSRVGQERETIADFIEALRLSPGNNPDLAREFIQILEHSPKEANSYYRRGIVRFNLKDFKGALEDFTHSLVFKQDFADAYYYRGLISKGNPSYEYDNKDSYTKIVEGTTPDFTKAIQFNPEFIDAYFERASVIRQLRIRFDKKLDLIVRRDLTKIIQINPNVAETFYRRAYYAKYPQDDHDDYTQAIRINPEFAFTFYKAGNVDCGGRGNPEKSTLFPEFNPDFSAGNHFTQTYALSGVIRLEIDRQKEAIKLYSQAIQVNSRDANAYYSRGFAHLYLGEMQAAIQDFNQAIQINPQDDNAYYRRGMAYHRQKKYQKALADYTQAIQLNSSSTDVYLMRGLAYYDSGYKQKAFEDTNQAIRLDPIFAEAYFIRGRVLFDSGYKTAAQEDFGMAHLHWPCQTACCGGSSIQGNPIALLNRGCELARRGDNRGAIQNLNQAATLFQKQGNTVQYQQTTDLIRQLRR